MKRVLVFTILAVIALLASSCIARYEKQSLEAELPNPASLFCEMNGGKLDLRTDAEGGVQGICVFPDGSECEEWVYFREECAPASADQQDQMEDEDLTQPAVPENTDSVPFLPDEYQGWWTYQNEEYGFSIMLPEDWVADEIYTSDPLMSGHFLLLHPRIETENDLNIRMSFRRKGEATLLWPTGVGAGEFVPLGTLEAAGQVLRRIGFKCPNGTLNMIWYHGPEETGPNIQVGDLEFGFFAYVTTEYCRDGDVIGEKLGRLSDMIIASLTLR